MFDVVIGEFMDATTVETLESLLSRSDGVTEAIASLHPGSVLINTARGGIVDESALADALCEGRIGGAMLDVFEREPLPADSGLRRASGCNLVLTPHVAGVTHESNVNISAMTARNVSRVLEGNA
ncbi:NAD(P)-dependent oxidoreductase [Salinicola lusitanus]|uniref:NAD(P)-dependent oxidoreductase n=1 Tax=Salinicola lusitanus TaxID=1949085 RepID=A0ABZ3CW24_9GAMM